MLILSVIRYFLLLNQFRAGDIFLSYTLWLLGRDAFSTSGVGVSVPGRVF